MPTKLDEVKRYRAVNKRNEENGNNSREMKNNNTIATKVTAKRLSTVSELYLSGNKICIGREEDLQCYSNK